MACTPHWDLLSTESLTFYVEQMGSWNHHLWRWTWATVTWGDSRGDRSKWHYGAPFLDTEYRLRPPTSLNLSMCKTTFSQCQSWNSAFVLFYIKSWRRSFGQGNIWADLKWNTLDKEHCSTILTHPLGCFRLQVTEYATKNCSNSKSLLCNNKRRPMVRWFPGLIHQFILLSGSQALHLFLLCHPQFKSSSPGQKKAASVPCITCTSSEGSLLERKSFPEPLPYSRLHLMTIGHRRINARAQSNHRKGE